MTKYMEPVEVSDNKVAVYAWCNSGGGTDWQTWMAMADTGHIFKSHCSSSRGWGMRDVGPTAWGSEPYMSFFGPDFTPDDIEYIVVPEGFAPPREVCDRNARLEERGIA